MFSIINYLQLTSNDPWIISSEPISVEQIKVILGLKVSPESSEHFKIIELLITTHTIKNIV